MTLSLRTLLSEYSSRSTVHGLSYIGDRHRHWIERTFWIVTFMISMTGCFFMVHKTYSKWQLSPLIVTQDDKFTPLSEIPFPAVTICPAIKLAHTNTNLTRTFDILRNFFEEIESIHESIELSDVDKSTLNVTGDDVKMLIAASMICVKSFYGFNSVHSDLKHFEIENFFKAHKPIWNKTFEIYSFKGIAGGKRLKWVLTEDGVCYTFNSQGNFQVFKKESVGRDFRPYETDDFGDGWNAENGYTPNGTDPLRAFKSQAEDALQLFVRQYVGDGGNTCPHDTSRLKVIVHSPGEFPRASQNFISIPMESEVSVTVKPIVMTTATDLTRYSTEIRQCYFNSERSLRFFKFYTRRNCEHECYTNFTLAMCGCVKISMPRDDSSVLCVPEQYRCLYNSDYFFRLSFLPVDPGFGNSFDELRMNFNLSHEQMALMLPPCGCLPSCVSLDYDITVTESDIAFREEIIGDSNLRSSVVNIFFKDESFLKLKRSEIYGWTEFMANCGGLLGLFMGVSILSLIEVIYYATLRLLCTCRFGKTKVSDEVTIIQTTKQRDDCRIVLEPEIIDWDKF